MKTTTFVTKHIAGFEDAGLGDQWATEAQIEESLRKNEERMALLKVTGEYGKPYFMTTTLIDNPMYDYRSLYQESPSSYKMEFLDFGYYEESNKTGE